MDRFKEKRRKKCVRHYRVRQKVHGTAQRPRLCVSRAVNHIYAQLIDDDTGRTLLAISTITAEIKKGLKTGGNIAAAKLVGKRLGEEALKRGIQQVVFDRGGLPYHGRIKALAQASREAGLKF